MSPLLKRILLIALLVLVAIGIGFGLYYLFNRTGSLTGVGTIPTTPDGQLPGSGDRPTTTPSGNGTGTDTGTTLPVSGVTPATPSPSFYQPTPVQKASSDYAIFPSLSTTGDVRYHNASDGRFYQIQPDGQIRTLADQQFYNVQSVTWAKAADKAVLEYPDGSKIIYNFDTKKQTTLPKHWEDFSFSPDGTQLAAKSMGLAPENRWLVTTKDDGSGTTLIEPLGDNGAQVQVAWSPSRQTVAFAQTGQALGLDRREVLLVGLQGENFKSTVVEGLDFLPAWSPTGKKLLYSVDSARSDFKPELWIVNAYGDEIGTNRQSLNINTWADKCSFGDDDTLFCAVPRDLPQGAGMARDVAKDSYDDLYKIDLKTGAKVPVPLGDDYHINNISFDKANNKVYFTDQDQTGIFEAKL